MEITQIFFFGIFLIFFIHFRPSKVVTMEAWAVDSRQMQLMREEREREREREIERVWISLPLWVCLSKVRQQRPDSLPVKF